MIETDLISSRKKVIVMRKESSFVRKKVKILRKIELVLWGK